MAGKSEPGRCRATPGRVEVCNGRYGETGWLGTATVWTEGRHVVQATVRVNDTYLAAPTGGLLAPLLATDTTGRRHVLCHEVGHALGLDHVGGDSCLNDDADPADPAHARPNAHDYAQVAAVYGHRDRPSGAAKNTFNAEESVPPDPLPGMLEGASELVEDLGGGRRRITIVSWLPA